MAFSSEAAAFLLPLIKMANMWYLGLVGWLPSSHDIVPVTISGSHAGAPAQLQRALFRQSRIGFWFNASRRWCNAILMTPGLGAACTMQVPQLFIIYSDNWADIFRSTEGTQCITCPSQFLSCNCPRRSSAAIGLLPPEVASNNIAIA